MNFSKPIHVWATVALVELVADDVEPIVGDRRQLVFVYDGTPSDAWPAEVILKNLRFQMNARYLRAVEDAGHATSAHVERLRQWVNQTRSVAADLPAVYGDRLARLLTDAADEVEQAIDWPARYILRPPEDPKGRARLFVAISQWAFDRIREAIEPHCTDKDGIPGKDAGRTRLLSLALTLLADAGLPHIRSDEGWKMAVRRLKVKPGQEADLVASVLDACRSGPFDRNGREMSAA